MIPFITTCRALYVCGRSLGYIRSTYDRLFRYRHILNMGIIELHLCSNKLQKYPLSFSRTTMQTEENDYDANTIETSDRPPTCEEMRLEPTRVKTVFKLNELKLTEVYTTPSGGAFKFAPIVATRDTKYSTKKVGREFQGRYRSQRNNTRMGFKPKRRKYT
mmetsp:Transcript_6908/g.7574  ORF Transcript_6908/g.7574 Transcript_6908/m.7574 type:complete len:161 (+) Transcript_6908:384-866(+)